MERVTGCRSEALCYDGVNMDWQKVAMQDPGGGAATEGHATAERGSVAMERRQSRPTTEQQQALRCPRCDSSNTKFCYYNNYNQSQPRHFCKNCRRYWTRGGALRNVPVGGGSRKNKRPKLRSTPEQQLQQQQQSSHDHPALHKPLISCPPPISSMPSPPSFFNLPSLAHQIDLSSAFPAATVQPFTSAIFSHLPSFPHPTLASLSSHLPDLDLRRSVLGLDNFNGVHTSFLDTASLQLAPPSAPPNGFNEFNGIDPIAKLALGLEESQMINGHVLGPYQGEEEQPLENLRPLYVPIKAEEESPSSTDWHGGQQAAAFYGQTSESNFWNNGLTWPNLHAHSTSASPLF